MDTLVNLQSVSEDNFEVQFEMLSVFPKSDAINERKKYINDEIEKIDVQIDKIQEEIDELNKEIDRLTNHADGFDYMIAVASGILTGVIDSFFVGEFNFDKAKAKSNQQVNNAIMKYAKLKGYKGERLNGAISFLEGKYPVKQDCIWKGKGIGVSAKNHHLADLAHHPTLLGLGAAIIVQFFQVGIFVNKDGEWNLESIEIEPKEMLKIWLPIIISGLLNWLVYIVEAGYEEKMDEEVPEPIHRLVSLLASAPAVIEILKVVNNWVGHLFSDMGGSKNTAGGGMGIPGLFISLLQEISSLPVLKDTSLPNIVNDLYVKNKIDMRSELAILNELGRQAIPVIIGEVLVRGFYFIRHLVKEIKEHEDIREVNWHNIIPFGNRTVERMMTISSGTFMTVDLADAAIHAAKNPSSVSVPTFLTNMVLRVNFVGVGRFAIAVVTDIGMGIKKESTKSRQRRMLSQVMCLSNTKLFYKTADLLCEYNDLFEREANMFSTEADMWVEVDKTQKSIDELYDEVEKVGKYYAKTIYEMDKSFDRIEQLLPKVKEMNPGLVEEMIRRIK